jgi:hypothetical protein
MNKLKVKWWIQKKIDDLTYPCRWFFGWVIKSAKYAWFLRNDKNWDWTYILKLLQYKLMLTRKCLAASKIRSFNPKQDKDIRTCELLLQRLIDDDYFLPMFEKRSDEYGLKTNDIESWIDRMNKLKGEDAAKFSKQVEEDARIEEMLKKQDIDLFCKIFSRKYRKWWD